MEKELMPSLRKSEEIQDIIDRMPTKFSSVVTIFLSITLLLLSLIGASIQYPDVVTGKLTIKTAFAPIKLISEADGKLKLNNVQSEQNVFKGQMLGWIENTTRPSEVHWLKSTVENIDASKINAAKVYLLLPKIKSLGKLTPYYLDLLHTIKALADLQENKLMIRQAASLNEILGQEISSLNFVMNQKDLSLKGLSVANRFFTRDSILHTKRVISESELDKSYVNKMTAISQHQQILREISSTQERISNTKKSIVEISIQTLESDNELILKVMSAKNLILEEIADWDKKYVLRAPFSGKIQFLGFLKNEEYIHSGQPVFTILPLADELVGQILLPAKGAGKVEKGQNVHVKLDNYPYMEYGSVKGKVVNISLGTNTQNTNEGPVEAYQVTIRLPRRLKTNYGTELKFNGELQGIAEIVTHDRPLISRFFETVKYNVAR